MAARKTGPLTGPELMTLWKSVTDPSYSRPLLENPGSNIAAIEQAADQLARVSESVDRNTQAMFILPWSGQTDSPAAGAAYSVVVLTVTRSKLFESPVTIAQGQVLFEQVVADWGKDAGVEVTTSRRYVAAEDLTFGPGEAGPFQLLCLSERPGYGYNLPAPGSIRRFVQPGAGLRNDGARVTMDPGTSTFQLIVRETPDVVVPEHVGRYVQFTAGSNIGLVARATGYAGPVAASNGGQLDLQVTQVASLSAAPTGNFVVGEEVSQGPDGAFFARGRMMRVTDGGLQYMVIDVLEGRFYDDTDFVGAAPIVGATSGASAPVERIIRRGDVTPEAGTAAWIVGDWQEDLGVTVTNEESPSGGIAAFLDELGIERGIWRAPNEDDELYRLRVSQPADTITPNALRRAANRVLTPVGGSGCLREVGLPSFRGFFFDGDANSTDPTFAFAFDLDFDIRPQDRFKVMLDHERFRAYFEMGVPPMGLDDFGIGFDEGGYNAFDASPYDNFLDGFPVGTAQVQRATWQALNEARAGGVGFDLYVERFGCVSG